MIDFLSGRHKLDAAWVDPVLLLTDVVSSRAVRGDEDDWCWKDCWPIPSSNRCPPIRRSD